MTRFAKRGYDNRKLNEPTPWSEMQEIKGTAYTNRNNFKDSRRENRRLKRKDQRISLKVCYNCRGPGHQVSNCPFLSEPGQQASCFKCGSTEHKSSSCNAKIPKESYPFAQCYICGEKGHLSKQCPDNPRGLYPNGGNCKQCGSVEHLKRDCPEFLQRRGNTEITVDTVEDGESADAEPNQAPVKPSDGTKMKKKTAKIVKF
ncbi:unnamed protein product [Lymnaea stagnalis]|uniref:CCHC-type domain-containing protein n=1 Tax=Lymnaea stagnalis TaxID=6523 RepID=A0AAV2H7W1_LYMST